MKADDRRSHTLKRINATPRRSALCCLSSMSMGFQAQKCLSCSHPACRQDTDVLHALAVHSWRALVFNILARA